MKPIYLKGYINGGKYPRRVKVVHYLVRDGLGYPLRALCNCDYRTVGHGLPSPIQPVSDSTPLTCLRCDAAMNGRKY